MNTVQLARRFVRDDWGGTETVILETSKHMLSMGHKTQVMCTMATSNHETDNFQGLKTRRFPYFYPYFGLSDEGKQLLDRKGGSPFSFSLMRALLKVPELDLLHLHVGNRIGGIGRHVAKRRKIPYVISLHGGVFDVPAEEVKSWTAPAQKALEWGKVLGLWVGSRRVLQDASAIICVGYQESILAQQQFPASRVIYLPNGANTKRFAVGDGNAFRDAYGIPQDANVLLTVARIDAQKNQHLLIHSLTSFLKIEPKTHLLIIGNVTNPLYYQQLLDLVSSNQLENSVTVIPGIPSDSQTLVDAYHAANAFVLPSTHEPFGIVILEAWAAGLPILASRVGGIPSFVDDGIDGLLFDPEDNDSISQAYNKLMQNTSLASTLAKAGRAKVCMEYDWEIITKKLLGIYEEVILENSIRQ